jgi:predicted acylesterase/phospholipase RssA
MQRSRFDSIVFAGGGNRCFWQAGFLSEAGESMRAPRQIAAVSAGAAMACVLSAGRAAEGLVYFKAATAANRRNVRLRNLFNGAPVCPHATMYRDALLATIDAEALDRLHDGPHIRVPVTRPPTWSPAWSALLVAGLADIFERSTRPAVHSLLARHLGFRGEYLSVRTCATPEALADLILASSCTPPITPYYRVGGRPALDGGITDNVPVDALEPPAGATLVLLTRRYRELPEVPGRRYVQPSSMVPVASWDYTDPAGIQAAFDLGRRDGAAFARTMD